MTSAEAVRLRLREAGLRVTSGRTQVYELLQERGTPLSHREAAEALPDMDRVTVFRNLVALADAGLAVRVDLGDRTWRFGLPEAEHHEHDHAHFACSSCGDIQCLDEVKVIGEGRAAVLLQGAKITIQGVCEICREDPN